MLALSLHRISKGHFLIYQRLSTGCPPRLPLRLLPSPLPGNNDNNETFVEPKIALPWPDHSWTTANQVTESHLDRMFSAFLVKLIAVWSVMLIQQLEDTNIISHQHSIKLTTDCQNKEIGDNSWDSQLKHHPATASTMPLFLSECSAPQW